MSELIEKDAIHVVEEDNIQPPPHYTDVAGPQIITSDTARQGPSGTPVLWVLICGLFAIGVAWVVIHWIV
jgi:hypothetical protein